MNNILIPFACCIMLISTPLLAQKQELPLLQVVSKVDLNRYLGTWYEIATIPQRFQKAAPPYPPLTPSGRNYRPCKRSPRWT